MKTACCCLAAITVAALLACSTSGPRSAAVITSDASSEASGGPEPLEAPPGQLALRVDMARRARRGVKAGRLQLAVTLANGVGGKPAPLLSPLFHLKTTDGRLRIPGIESAAMDDDGVWVDGSVPTPGELLADGASFQISLFFDVGDDEPVELSFALPQTGGIGDSRSATARVPPIEPCRVCGDVCTYLDRDRLNCGECNVALRGAKIECRSGHARCTTPTESVCPSEQGGRLCVDLVTGPELCGTCDARVPRGAHCEAGKLRCANPKETPCAEGCSDTSRDRANCGKCGAVVPEGGACADGVVRCNDPSAVACGGKCVNLKSDDANCGSCGHACTQGATCGRFDGDRAAAPPGQCDILVFSNSFPAGTTCNSFCASKGFTCTESTLAEAIYNCPGGPSFGEEKALRCDTPVPASIPPNNCRAASEPLVQGRCTCIQP